MEFYIDEDIVTKFLDYLQNIYINFYDLIAACDTAKVEIYSFHFRNEAIC